MAEITARRTGEFLRKLFEILLKEPEGLQAKEALQRLSESVTLTDYEAGFYEGGGRRFEKVVRFATVDCVKAGWFLKNKGTWSITADGDKAYKKHSDPEAFCREAARLYRQWRSSREPVAVPTNGAVDSAPEDTEIEKSAGITFETAEEQAWSEIEQYVGEMNPYDFQELVAELLRAMDYHVSWVSPPGKDSGVDILAHTDPLGTRSPRIKVQVKRVGQRVPAEGLRAFVELIGDEDVGLYVSTAGFTKDAEDYARGHRNKRITLIDLKRLVTLWIKSYEKLEDRARQRLPLAPIYFLSPKT